MTDAERTAQFLANIDLVTVEAILDNIAVHYGISIADVMDEICDPDAECLLDYLTGPLRDIVHALMPEAAGQTPIRQTGSTVAPVISPRIAKGDTPVPFVKICDRAFPTVLNGYPVKAFTISSNGTRALVLVDRGGGIFDRWVAATWWPELGDTWMWGNYFPSFEQADAYRGEWIKFFCGYPTPA